ncbi:restriction endonuclease subunit S [Fusobacterium nucleatum]|uniref:restriction endonuclease subunit S n=1 Tax=Fusobacterium nucleatum TaxID=851 RepID=UPI0030D150FF
MSKIMDIIKNEKVEWRKLGEVCDIIKGKQFNKRDMLEDGKYPVINGGITPSGYVEVYNQSANTITISQGGASAGFINFIENKFWLGAHAFAINPKDTVLNRYIYHFLKLNQEKLQDKKEGAGIPSISKTTLESLEIPIPSLETQEKIVKVLDKFTNYVTELQAELQDRTKQYSYYRNMLLSKENLNKLSKKLDKIEDKKYELRITTLGEIGEFTRGNGLQKSDFRDVGKPVIHYGQIYTKYNISTDKTFSFTDEETFKRLRKAKPNDILIATTSENIEDVAKCVVWLGNTEIGFSGDMYSYNTNENSKYIAYYFQTIEFQRQKERKVTGTKLIRIHGEDMAKFIIPLPSISIQNKVVEILDQFQSLLSETQGLLPKEIEQRQKQYEFYREKLLTFDEKYDSLPACLPYSR